MNQKGAATCCSRREIVAPGAPWSACLRRNQALWIVHLEGEQHVDFLCYDAANPRERLRWVRYPPASSGVKVAEIMYSSKPNVL